MVKYNKTYLLIVIFASLLTISGVIAAGMLFARAHDYLTLLLLISAVAAGLCLFVGLTAPVLLAKARVKKMGLDKYFEVYGEKPYFGDFFFGQWNDYFAQISRHIEDEHTKTDAINQMKFQALQAQINPHFLYNTLDSIRGLAYLEDAEQTAEMTEALSAYCRYNISHSDDIVTMEQEISNLHFYLIIQKYRFGAERFKVMFNIDEMDMSLMNLRIPKLIIQPLVENALLHGLEKKTAGGEVRITVERTANRVYIRVADNGVGMSPEQVSKLNVNMLAPPPRIQNDMESGNGNGVALVNIIQRLKYMYGNDCSLNFSSALGAGTEVELALPFSADMEVIYER